MADDPVKSKHCARIPSYHRVHLPEEKVSLGVQGAVSGGIAPTLWGRRRLIVSRLPGAVYTGK